MENDLSSSSQSQDTINQTELTEVGASWYYSWGYSTWVTSPHVPFVPMAWSNDDISKLPSLNTYVLGFNEPDNSSQSNISVATALSAWPSLVSRAIYPGSPAVAGNAVSGTWLPAFMAGSPTPTVSFIPVHYYPGDSVSNFENYISSVCSTYNLPVWVTEFAVQTDSQSSSNPTQYSQSDVNNFIASTTAWMNANSCVQRYSWHSSTTGTSDLFNADGSLTSTGTAYAQVP